MSLTNDAAAASLRGSELASLMSGHDWSGSPLGPPERWPQSLRTVVSLMRHSKFPMFIAWGPELGFLYNDPYVEILGNKHPAAWGRRFQEVWAEIWDDILPLVEQTKAGVAVYRENLPLTMNRKGFEEHTYFTFTYSPVTDENGNVAGMFCTCTETTAAVLAERHRQNENERLRQLFEQAPGIMAVMRGPEHIFELANNAYLDLVGARDLIGKPVRQALPEVQGQGFFELLDEVFETGKPFVGRGLPVKLQRRKELDPEERYVDFIYQPIWDLDGNVSGIFLEGSDVSSTVQAHEALRQSEERYRLLINTIDHLAWIADAEGEVQWYNDRWYEYSGATLEELQGSGWSRLLTPDDLAKVSAAWQESVETGKSYEITVPLRRADGEFRTFFGRAAPVRDAAGTVIQWVGTNTDITAILQAQEELKAADRRKDEFLAMLAHELRNPLAPIGAAAELLQRAQLNDERVRQTSQVIGRQVHYMTSLVDDLLDVSRVTRGLVDLDNTPLDVTQIVADAVEQVTPLIRSRHHHLALHLSPEVAMVTGDKKRLVQIIANILNNAAKYTPEGGHISLDTEVTDTNILIGITDTGIGMTPELLSCAFDLFAQAERTSDRSSGGLGLGLSLVKTLVELHHGTVTCESAGLGKGSKFTVRLPRLMIDDRHGDSSFHDRDIQKAAHSLRIMIVDDNVDAALMLGMLLEAFGHKVRVEHGARAALEQTSDPAPQVFLLDIGLPEIDGNELARRLRSQPETAKAILIAVTGYGEETNRRQTTAAGFDHHLVKPVDSGKLMAILDAVRNA